MGLESVKYEDRCLEVVDQLLLPDQIKYLKISSVEDGWSVINKMQVRGAPAISIVGALSLAVEISLMKFDDFTALKNFVSEKMDYLVTARPTAVNMAKTAQSIMETMGNLSKSTTDIDEIKESLVKTIESMLSDDIATNKSIGDYGSRHIMLKCCETDRPVTVLTHCNTGSLATAGYGTALGVIRSLHTTNRLRCAFFTETRPYLQGARLTSLELVSENVPSVMICDSAVGALMAGARGGDRIDAVVVGADRVTANGDTANKIGTYQLAVLAKYHQIPFYVAAPLSSVDWQQDTASQVVVEERSPQEMTHMCGRRICAAGVTVWNPAFDITPAELISGGIITERGVFSPEELHQIRAV